MHIMSELENNSVYLRGLAYWFVFLGENDRLLWLLLGVV